MNFNAGPATLPLPALVRAREELLELGASGMSVMEHSHRGKEYEAIHDETIALLRELLGIPATHDVVFMQGGATQQFAQVPLNFLTSGTSADYVVTGVWGEKAVDEAVPAAAMVGGAGAKIRIAATTAIGAKPAQFVRTPQPSETTLDPDAAYVHFTSNETIHGVQFAVEPGAAFPDFGRAPVVCDMSSDFLWRPIDVSKFDLVYAGAQKNVGPSGVVIVIAKKDFVARGRKDLPKIFQYRAFVEANSLLNTPNTWGIYLARNVLLWLKELGGLKAMEARNREKARIVYDAIDAHGGFYRCPVEAKSRSVMNVVFRLPTEALEEKLVKDAKARGIVGIKGHRSVGGMRVSLYNAVEPEWCRALAQLMDEFARANGEGTHAGGLLSREAGLGSASRSRGAATGSRRVQPSWTAEHEERVRHARSSRIPRAPSVPQEACHGRSP
jgi:phosphoserine aminotransferase